MGKIKNYFDYVADKNQANIMF